MKKIITILMLLTATALYADTSVDIAFSFIQEREAFRANVYILKGVKHIGYGFTDPKLVKLGRMTKKRADAELRKMIESDLVFLRSQVKGLNKHQEAACLSFIYNTGRGAFASSTMLKHLKQGNITAASNEFDKWVYANGVVMNGLVKRRSQEKRLMLKAV